MPKLPAKRQPTTYEQWLASFPFRVWEQSREGLWSSREPTRADWARRNEAALELASISEDRDRAEDTTV